MGQELLWLAGSIAGLTAAVGVAVLFALSLSMRRDAKRMRDSLSWHDESLAETPPVHELAPPTPENSDLNKIAA